jgi:antitoxin YefM
MTTLSVNEFRANLKKIVDKVASEHEPVRVSRKRGSTFVVISEEDWNSEQETLYVLQNSKLMAQIASSLNPKSKRSKKLTKEELHAEFGVQR